MAEHNWENKQILIAEDELMNYLYLEEVLSDTKIKIIWCKNGKEAVDLVASGKEKVDVILMDIKMPVMNGYEATKLIKEQAPEIPIILQSAYAMQDEKEKGFSVGCNEYLEKPIGVDKLLDTIKKHFD